MNRIQLLAPVFAAFLGCSGLTHEPAPHHPAAASNFVVVDNSRYVAAASNFVVVDNNRFMRQGQPFLFLGVNFWSAMNLGSAGPGGDRARLGRELDHLRNLGIRNLRIMASGEGSNSLLERMVPSLQAQPGVYDEAVFEGLDYVLDEMKKRDMVAVLCLNNFWHWSGGMPQYINWSTGASLPRAWAGYESFLSGFYVDARSLEMFENHVRTVVSRVNTISGTPYRDDPVIMAWELANEPREADKPANYREWVRNTSTLIKSLDSNHLITIGSEGAAGSPNAGIDFEIGTMMEAIDYTTAHIWVEDWNWYNPAQHDETYSNARDKFFGYLDTQIAIAKKLGKPIVLEEFGIARDNRNFEPLATTVHRDQFLRDVFARALDLIKNGSPLAGFSPWAWAGEGRPPRPGERWHNADPWTGDPPHEPQGWYSIYDHDTSTLRILRDFATELKAIASSQVGSAR